MWSPGSSVTRRPMRVIKHVSIEHCASTCRGRQAEVADLGLEITPRGFGDACEVRGGEIEQYRAKSYYGELVLRLHKAINSLGLTQRAAARRIGTTQPELSKILGGKFTEVSLERLMRFLTALGCHIGVKIGARQENKAGDVTIKDVRRTAA